MYVASYLVVCTMLVLYYNIIVVDGVNAGPVCIIPILWFCHQLVLVKGPIIITIAN